MQTRPLLARRIMNIINRRTLAVFCIVAGVTYLAAPPLQMYLKRHEGSQVNPSLVQRTQTLGIATHVDEGLPGVISRIKIDRLGIDLPVQPAVYNPANQTWNLDITHAFYAPAHSEETGNFGTSFIYAHNRKGMFYELRGAAAGEVLELVDQNGKSSFYEYQSDAIISPDNIAELQYNRPQTIALVTCDGPTFAERRVMFFNPIEPTAVKKTVLR